MVQNTLRNGVGGPQYRNSSRVANFTAPRLNWPVPSCVKHNAHIGTHYNSMEHCLELNLCLSGKLMCSRFAFETNDVLVPTLMCALLVNKS